MVDSSCESLTDRCDWPEAVLVDELAACAGAAWSAAIARKGRRKKARNLRMDGTLTKVVALIVAGLRNSSQGEAAIFGVASLRVRGFPRPDQVPLPKRYPTQQVSRR